MSIEKAEQSRNIKNYRITVAITNPHWSKIKAVDKELTEVLDKIQEALER